MCLVNAHVVLDLYRCALVMHSLYLTSSDVLVVLTPLDVLVVLD